MKFISEIDYRRIDWYTLSVAAVTVLLIFLIVAGGPSTSFAQKSPAKPTALYQASTLSMMSSERLGPPLITSEAPEPQEETAPRGLQQQQQYSLYDNPQHNFSIEYPSDWQVEERRAGVVATFSSHFETNFDPFAANFAIGVEDLTAGKYT